MSDHEVISDTMTMLLRALANKAGVRDQLSEISGQCPTSTTLDSEPIRTIHHLSCTGGTLFTKCIAAMPNVVVLNEVDPFSLMQVPKGKPRFTPTDIVALVRQGQPTLANYETIREMFLDSLSLLRRKVWARGGFLVLRDHSHSRYLYGNLDETSPTLRQVIAERFPVRSVVTTRDCEASFGSMVRQGWHEHFQPPTLYEYNRRRQVFENHYKDVPKIGYEELTTNPQVTMQRICIFLNLPYFEKFEETFSALRFSGDSGRGGRQIVDRNVYK
jgi:hypothetical protein